MPPDEKPTPSADEPEDAVEELARETGKRTGPAPVDPQAQLDPDQVTADDSAAESGPDDADTTAQAPPGGEPTPERDPDEVTQSDPTPTPDGDTDTSGGPVSPEPNPTPERDPDKVTADPTPTPDTDMGGSGGSVSPEPDPTPERDPDDVTGPEPEPEPDTQPDSNGGTQPETPTLDDETVSEATRVSEGEELQEGATRENRINAPAAQGFEVAARRLPGDLNRKQEQLQEASRKLEQRVIDDNEFLTDESQVRIDRQGGGRLAADLTTAGLRRLEGTRAEGIEQQTEQLQRRVAEEAGPAADPDDVAVSLDDGQIQAGLSEQAERRVARQQIAAESQLDVGEFTVEETGDGGFAVDRVETALPGDFSQRAPSREKRLDATDAEVAPALREFQAPSREKVVDVAERPDVLRSVQAPSREKRADVAERADVLRSVQAPSRQKARDVADRPDVLGAVQAATTEKRIETGQVGDVRQQVAEQAGDEVSPSDVALSADGRQIEARLTDSAQRRAATAALAERLGTTADEIDVRETAEGVFEAQVTRRQARARERKERQGRLERLASSVVGGVESTTGVDIPGEGSVLEPLQEADQAVRNRTSGIDLEDIGKGVAAAGAAGVVTPEPATSVGGAGAALAGGTLLAGALAADALTNKGELEVPDEGTAIEQAEIEVDQSLGNRNAFGDDLPVPQQTRFDEPELFVADEELARGRRTPPELAVPQSGESVVQSEIDVPIETQQFAQQQPGERAEEQRGTEEFRRQETVVPEELLPDEPATIGGGATGEGIDNFRITGGSDLIDAERVETPEGTLELSGELSILLDDPPGQDVGEQSIQPETGAQGPATQSESVLGSREEPANTVDEFQRQAPQTVPGADSGSVLRSDSQQRTGGQTRTRPGQRNEPASRLLDGVDIAPDTQAGLDIGPDSAAGVAPISLAEFRGATDVLQDQRTQQQRTTSQLGGQFSGGTETGFEPFPGQQPSDCVGDLPGERPANNQDDERLLPEEDEAGAIAPLFDVIGEREQFGSGIAEEGRSAVLDALEDR